MFGYFGKLPNFPDFVRYNSAGEELLAFDKWIQEGITGSKLKLKSAWEKIFKNSPLYSFLFNYQGSKKFLAGSLFPSEDKSSRYYPFITILKFNKSFIDFDRLFMMPVILKDFSEKMFSAYNFLAKCNNVKELDNFIESYELDIKNFNAYENDYAEYLQNTKLNDFWERITGSPDESKKLNIINNLLFISPGLKQSSNAAFSFAIKILLPSEKTFSSFDIGYFINLILNLVKSPLQVSALFWSYPNSGSFNSLFIIFGRLSPQNLHELINPGYISDNSIDLKNRIDGEGLKYLSADLKALMENKSLSLSEFYACNIINTSL